MDSEYSNGCILDCISDPNTEYEINPQISNININFLELHSEVMGSNSDSQLKDIYFAFINQFPLQTTIMDITLYLIDKYNTTDSCVKYLILAITLVHICIVVNRNNDFIESETHDLRSKIEENWNKYINLILESAGDN
jgi:hypothetical protein